jgi:NADPH-dependent 2,4-dienoyl-CoA reductase/sulfur reductase-like enzyme
MFGGTVHRIEHWTMPTDMAGHAARSLLAGIEGAALEGPPFFPIPTFWSEQYGVRIQSFGLPALGLDDVRVLEGDLRSEGVVGFHRDGVLVGVVLFGMGKQMVTYRQKLVEETRAAGADLTGGAVR